LLPDSMPHTLWRSQPPDPRSDSCQTHDAKPTSPCSPQPTLHALWMFQTPARHHCVGQLSFLEKPEHCSFLNTRLRGSPPRPPQAIHVESFVHQAPTGPKPDASTWLLRPLASGRDAVHTLRASCRPAPAVDLAPALAPSTLIQVFGCCNGSCLGKKQTTLPFGAVTTVGDGGDLRCGMLLIAVYIAWRKLWQPMQKSALLSAHVQPSTY
jgi:hypothetical protein